MNGAAEAIGGGLGRLLGRTGCGRRGGRGGERRGCLGGAGGCCGGGSGSSGSPVAPRILRLRSACLAAAAASIFSKSLEFGMPALSPLRAARSRRIRAAFRVSWVSGLRGRPRRAIATNYLVTPLRASLALCDISRRDMQPWALRERQERHRPGWGRHSSGRGSPQPSPAG
jgi:hypothetical protein